MISHSAKVMLPSSFTIHPNVWRFLGFGSSIVGFSCYALSHSFQEVFGGWNLLKIVLYCLLSLIFCVMMLFVDNCPRISRGFLLKTHVGFLVVMITSLYSYYEGRSKEEQKGYRSMLSLVSFGAFALMSLSLSRQIRPHFDAGMSNFFLGCLIVAVMKKNIKIALAAAVFFHLVIAIRSCTVSLPEPPNVVGDTEEPRIMEIGNSQLNVDDHDGEAETERVINVSQSHKEMQGLSFTNDGDGYQEAVTIYEIGNEDEQTSEAEIWLRAYEGTANHSSPL